MSYVRSDDDHDNGRITELRRRLEGEVRMQTGRTFDIFQDRNDMRWGDNWKERLDDNILSITFIIPIITPSYLRSEMRRDEFETLLIREKTFGVDRLILPIYYVDTDEINEVSGEGDEVAKVIRTRNWADWRGFRFKELTSLELQASIADLAIKIKTITKELEGVITAAERRPSKAEVKSTIAPVEVTALLKIAGAEVLTDDVPVVIRAKKFAKSRLKDASKSPYYVYTDEFDEEISPVSLLIQELHSNYTPCCFVKFGVSPALTRNLSIKQPRK